MSAAQLPTCPARWLSSVQAPGQPAGSVTNDDDRRQRAKQYLPIRRASNKQRRNSHFTDEHVLMKKSHDKFWWQSVNGSARGNGSGILNIFHLTSVIVLWFTNTHNSLSSVAVPQLNRLVKRCTRYETSVRWEQHLVNLLHVTSHACQRLAARLRSPQEHGVIIRARHHSLTSLLHRHQHNQHSGLEEHLSHILEMHLIQWYWH